ncbi:hypothetical protein CJF43_11085 [Pseudomonas fragi]|mgnify:FL=1|jgi:hypothetical protein|uniref:Lipoprotein n=2 Tax=Pseudomonas TaxID=286 RepID=A0A6A7YQU2_9PSED|nr:hypothetical protein [Pseudomonas sp. FSL R10-0056]MQT79331.1 hypothetical protein [Pseudomonas helleri]MQU54831.1 hypothetical protein [Pseudomonas sp. FSL R10-1339]OZY41782.1 hypothetical protein CJF43_11085 [Pseudomonas fragi]PAA04448.1 hypothetical protein CJU76_07185 [Pseudomonas fragi]
MFTRSLLLSFCAVLLVGCTGRGFQTGGLGNTPLVLYGSAVCQRGKITSEAMIAKSAPPVL